MHRLQVGDVEVTALVDLVQAYGAASVYADAGDALARYAEHLDAEGRVTLGFTSFLIRADGRTILVDTGNGPEASGQLLEELAGAGVAPTEVDSVIFTHLHGDHTGWNLDRATGRPLFPSARYLVPRGDWEHYGGAKSPPASFTRDVAPLEGLGVLELVQGDHAVTPSVVTLHTPGHTPGHLALTVTSGGAEAYVIGDAFLTQIDVAEPDWVTTWDWDAALTRATRTTLAARIEATDALIASAHLPAPGLGRFAVVNGRRTWQAVT